MKLDFMVCADLFMTPTAELADIVLPAASWPELDQLAGLPTVAANVVLAQQKAVRIGECRSDEEIFVALARRMKLSVGTESVEEVLDAQLKAGGLGMTFAELKQRGFVKVPFKYRKYEEADSERRPARSSSIRPASRRWATRRCRATQEPPESPVSRAGQSRRTIRWCSRPAPAFRSTSIPSTGRSKSCARRYRDPLADIHPDTAARYGIKNRDWMWIETRRGRMRQRARVTTGIDPRVIAAEHGWWFPEEPAPDIRRVEGERQPAHRQSAALRSRHGDLSAARAAVPCRPGRTWHDLTRGDVVAFLWGLRPRRRRDYRCVYGRSLPPACGSDVVSGARSALQASAAMSGRHPMKFPRRQFLQMAARAAPLLVLPGIASAQTYPMRPVRLVVAFVPGGATDTLARQISNDLKEVLGQAIVVENRPGANGYLAWNHVAAAEPDGYTLLLAENALAMSQALYKKAASSFDPLTQYDAVAGIATSPSALIISNNIPATTVDELVVYSRTVPGKMNYASAGVGSVAHLNFEVFKDAVGMEAIHIPYKGGGQGIADVVAGHVPMMITSVQATKSLVEARQIKALAVTGTARSPAMPAVPTMEEAGVKGADVELRFWFGLFGPKGMPDAVKVKLEKAIAMVTSDAHVRERLANLDITPDFTTGIVLRAKLESEIRNWTKFIDEKGIKPE